MDRRLLITGIVGGIIAFAWGIFSWMFLPWHKVTIEKFKNDYIVAKVIQENAPVNGVYVLPNMYHYNDQMTQEQVDEEENLIANGPFVFAAVSVNGMNHRSFAPFIGSLIIQMIGGILTAWLLFHSRALKYMRKVFFIAVVGLLVGFLSFAPAWNWWGLPAGYTIVGIIDLFIAWFLAGLAMAKVSEKK
jgi:hypothetical protein